MKILHYKQAIALLFLSIGPCVLDGAQRAQQDSPSSVRSDSQKKEYAWMYQHTPVTIDIFLAQQSIPVLSYKKKSSQKPNIVVNPNGLNFTQPVAAHNIQSSSSATTTPANATPLACGKPDANAIARITELSQKLASLALNDTTISTSSSSSASSVKPNAYLSNVQNAQSTSSASAIPAPEVMRAQATSSTEPHKEAPIESSEQEEYLAIWTERIKRTFVTKKILTSPEQEDMALVTRFKAAYCEQGSEEAMALYRQAAQQGDALSQTYLAINHLLLKECTEALALLATASTMLDDAKILRAYCYQYGIGMKENKEEAQTLLTTSSKYQEDPEAVLLDLEYLHNTIRLGL